MAQVKPIPDGFHTLTPHIICDGAARAIDWYKKAFGAVELSRSPMPGSDKLIHSLVRFGDSLMMIVDEFPQMNAVGPATLKNSPVTLHMYVENADAVVKRATEAGAKVTMPLTDMFWGDRYAKLEDPFGHHWSIATKIANPTPAEMEAAMKAAYARMPPK
ncbi:MAG: VOC family protein [Gemmataceae bacterium]